MKKVAIFQTDVNVGGIQKSLLNILGGPDLADCRVDCYLFDDSRFFDMPERENVRYIFLRPYNPLSRLVPFGLLKRFFPMPETDETYDAAVDFNSYRQECAVGALSVRAKKRVMWIHNDVEVKFANEPKYRVLWHFFKGKFQCFDAFAAVSPGVIDGFCRMTGTAHEKVTAVPNHIDTDEIFRKMGEKIDFRADAARYNLCTMGRLCHQKGFDILLDILAEARKKRTDLMLYILGDGPDRAKLERRIRALGLGGAVVFLGNRKNPFPYLAQMDGFVLTSRYEGQGMVIWEAKAVGLELFISKNLEAYNPGVRGREDMVSALIGAKRRPHAPDDLAAYNAEITEKLRAVLGL